MVTKDSPKRRASCECGACPKCKHRKRAADFRASSETYRANQASAAREAYRALSVEERKARSAKNAGYQRQYKKANRERIKLLNAENRAANREKRSTQAHERYLTEREKVIARAKAWGAANPKATAERAAKWNKANPERRAEIRRKWDKENPEAKRMSCADRRARIRGSAGKITVKQVKDLFVKQKGKCTGCRKKMGDDFELDHVTPLALGGAHSIENAQLLCMPCNRKKGAMPDTAWAASLGRLFA